MNESGNLIENIYPLLVFRNEAAFKIPKAIREKGYIQSLDVFIESISWNLYENGKGLPPIQFYGYVCLVMQDSAVLEIPLHYPRQRIWHYRVEQALNQWRDIHIWNTAMEKWELFFYGLFTNGVEEPPPAPPIEYPDTNFVESPLREVYIKCPDGTQFQVEITQWEPVPFTGYRNKSFDGKSRQIDGDKDSGFPAVGIQPRRNPPSDPWGGNRNPTDLNSAGAFQFFTDKTKLFDSPPEYIPLRPPFEGGQCAGIQYRITVFGRVGNPSNPNAPASISIAAALGTNLVRLKIGKIVSVEGILVNNTAQVRFVTSGGSVTENVFVAGFGQGTFIEVTEVRVERVDGQVDGCGSLPVLDPTQF